jgi:ferritin
MRTILTPKMENALNKQVNAELWSAYLYLSMSYDMKDKGLDGIANWFFVQAQEEFEHAKRIMDYIISMDGKVKLLPIAEEVQQTWNSPKDAFENALMHEKIVTDKIHTLTDLAIELKDYATQSMLKWFVDEQVEEEDTARSLLQTLKMIDGDKSAMYLFDRKSGKRELD